MRTFVQGAGHDRKFVLIEADGPRMSVTRGKADGVTQRSEKELGSEAAVASASDKMARELIARGYVEQTPKGTMKTMAPKKVATPAPQPKAAPPPRPSSPVVRERRSAENELLVGGDEEEEPAPVSKRNGRASAASPAVPPPRATRDEAQSRPKKKKKRRDADEKKDWVTLGGLAAVGLVIVGVTGHFLWSAFLKPTTIVGSWQGSRVDKDLGGPITYANYKLILDDQGRAALSVLDSDPMIGTYKVEGDRLKLNLTESEDGESVEFKFKLSTVTLDLFEPGGGRKIVELVRKFEMEPVPKPAKKKQAPPPPDRDEPGGGEMDPPDEDGEMEGPDEDIE